jgi:DMSO reductase anchor subunit
MVYKDTKRPFWDNHMTTIKFFLTSVILGFGLLLVTTTLWSVFLREDMLLRIASSTGQIFVRIIFAAACLKLHLELTIFSRLMDNEVSFLKKTAVLMAHHLRKHTFWRFGCGVVGGILLPWGFAAWGAGMPPVGAAGYVVVLFAALLAGELLERYLFFRAVVPLKMPGTRQW